jgi:membrane associated rhomboid family serine protease
MASDQEPVVDSHDEPEERFVAWGTLALFALNGAAFFTLWSAGASPMLVEPPLLVAAGGASAMDIWQGEVWRLLTTMFVHGAIWHLALNMWVFLQVGRELERMLGLSRFLLLYLVSGLYGAALSLLVHPQLSVGASGAIFGVVGGLLAWAAVYRGRRFSRVLFSALGPFVVVTLIVGLLVPFIDNSAHVGGLVCGFLLGIGLIPLDKPEEDGALPRLSKATAWGALALVAGSLLALLPTALAPTFNPNYQTAQAWTALRTGRVDEARAYANKASALAPDDPAVLLLFARLSMGVDDDEARALFAQAVEALDEPDPLALMGAVQGGMVGGWPLGDIAWAFDVRTTRGLCDALLAREENKPPAGLANNCAWVMVKSTDPLVRDVLRGRALARRAVALEQARVDGNDEVQTESLGAYLHTLAEAHAQAGFPEEARITLERLVVLGYGDDNPVYREDLERFRAMTQTKTSPDGPDAGVATEPTPLSPRQAAGGHFARAEVESAMMDGGAGAIDATPSDPELHDGGE